MFAKPIARSFGALLTLVLLLMPMTAMASASAEEPSYNVVNIWGIMPGGTIVYRDAEMSAEWGAAPRDLIMNVVAYKGDVALVKNGNKYAYCLLNDFKTLTGGTELVSARSTRVYQSPSTKSRYMNIPKGLDMEFVALNGNCAEVRRGDYVGYVYIGHIQPAN